MNARRAWWVRYVARVAGPTFAASDREEEWGWMLRSSVGVDTPAVRRKLERELRRNARPDMMSGFHVQRTRAGAGGRGKTRISGAEGLYFIDEPAPDAPLTPRLDAAARASTPPVVAHTPKRGRAAWLAAAMLAALAAGGAL